MITGWRNVSVMRAPTMRAITSELPPAENGTTIRTGRSGHDCAAAAGRCDIAAHSTAAASATRARAPFPSR